MTASPEPAGTATFDLVTAGDPLEFERRMEAGSPFPAMSRSYKYRFLDPALTHTRFAEPVLSLALRSAGPIIACYGGSRVATEVLHEGAESQFIGFSTILRGETKLSEGEASSMGTASRGLVFRLRDQTRMLMSDDSARTHVSFRIAELEAALEHMLDARLRRPLEFDPEIDWSNGLAASLKWQLAFLMKEFARPDGVVGNAPAFASMTDFLLTLALRAARHNHSEKLSLGPALALPAYIHRAEEFMRVNATAAIRMADVAAAAGCSLRTLNAVFQHFRGQAPLAALQAIRLEQVHAALLRGGDDEGIGVIARRYGFTNASRFNAAFHRRFGKTAREVFSPGLRR